MLRDRVYKFLVEYKLAHDGIAPSVRTIQDALGVGSSSTVYEALKDLEVRGQVVLERRGAWRGIRVVGGHWVAPDGRAGEVQAVSN